MQKPLSTSELEALLCSKSVSDRTQAMRHYENFGSTEDIDFLIQIAATDTSVAVRNSASDAISDILSRVRVSPYKESFSDAQRHTLLKQFRRIKVQQTPAVNLAYASVGTSRALNILLSGFVDPRVELQNCAAAGLRCFCLSQDVVDDPSVEDSLIKLLIEGTLDVPGIAHIVRLCAEAGYQKILPVLKQLPDLGNLGEIVDACRLQLTMSQQPPTGLWFSNGLDALEFNPQAERGEEFLLLVDNTVLHCQEGQWSADPNVLEGPSRRLYFRPIGSMESVQAIQTTTKTWRAAQAPDVQILLQQETQLDQPSNPQLASLVNWLETKLKDNQKNSRYLAILAMRSELWDLCGQYVEKSMSYKKVSPDIWYVESKRLQALGQTKNALEAIERCIMLAKEGTLLMRQCQSLKQTIEAQ